jgi:uncharacterized protein YecE (DUF72 family)
VAAAERARLGTAGWALPRFHAHQFPRDGTGLQRYAARFNAAEINSTFYRTHKRQTFERWAASVPEDFRFAVKMPRAITHERRLTGVSDLQDEFLTSLAPLGAKLGPLLVQLPPSLGFDRTVAERFFARLRGLTTGEVVCEPRHPSWFAAEAEELFAALQVARVGADPAPCPGAERPGGWPELAYWRLHGSPAKYRSPYPDEMLERLAGDICSRLEKGTSAWCIFDNTVTGAATGDALKLAGQVGDRP